MSDSFSETEATEKKTRKARAPYQRTGLDDEVLAMRRIMSQLKKLPDKASRQRALVMVNKYVDDVETPPAATTPA